MYLEELVEVAIGMIFVFLVLSLASMEVQEILAGLLRWRSNHLEDVIRTMLNDTAAKKPSWFIQRIQIWWLTINHRPLPKPTLIDKVYDHPFIRSLSRPGMLPSYIPTEKFSAALFDVIMTAGSDHSVIQKALVDLKTNPAMVASQSVKAVLNDPTLRPELMSLVTNIVQAALDKSPALADWEQKAQQFLKDHPDLEPAYEMFLKIEKLSLQAASAGDNSASLSDLWKAIDDFLWQYPEIKPIFSSIMQGTLPTQASAAIDQIEQGANVLMIDHPELKRTLDSLIANARTYGERILSDQALARLKEAASALADAQKDLKADLDHLVAQAENSLQEGDTLLAMARQNVESWFNDTMARSSGWYKRNAQWISLVIGISLALIFNVDAVRIINRLWSEPVLRRTLVAQAEKFSFPDQTNPSELSKTLDNLQNSLTILQIPVGWNFSSVPFDPLKQRCVLQVQDAAKDVRGLYFFGQCLVWSNAPLTANDWVSKLLGVLICGLATMQGAPFWFDLLGKLVNIRNAGPVPK
jgi:hypothetical protein